MAELNATNALDLAKVFEQSALALGQYQLEHWDDLSTSQREGLKVDKRTLLDHSQNLVTYAVGIILDEAQGSLDQIKKATAIANNVIQTITDAKKVLAIASALVALAASICVGNPTSIASAVGNIMDLMDV
jgi:hypothetical protein